MIEYGIVEIKDGNGSMFEIKHVANCFLQEDFAHSRGTITPMKLQKLIYYLHGWHLAITGKPAIVGKFEAWPYGPIEEKLFHILKGYENNFITCYINSWAGSKRKAFVVARDLNTEFYNIFKFVYNRYRIYSALELSSMSHDENSPWKITRDNNETIIADTLIKQHFISLTEEALAIRKGTL